MCLVKETRGLEWGITTVMESLVITVTVTVGVARLLGGSGSTTARPGLLDVLQDGRHLVLKHGAERLVLVLDDTVEEERDVLLPVACLAQVKQVLDDLCVADEPRADLVRLAVPDHVSLLKQAIADLNIHMKQVMSSHRAFFLMSVCA